MQFEMSSERSWSHYTHCITAWTKNVDSTNSVYWQDANCQCWTTVKVSPQLKNVKTRQRRFGL